MSCFNLEIDKFTITRSTTAGLLFLPVETKDRGDPIDLNPFQLISNLTQLASSANNVHNKVKGNRTFLNSSDFVP